MKKRAILTSLFFFLFTILEVLRPTQSVFAATAPTCQSMGINVTTGSIGGVFNEADPNNRIEFGAGGLQPNSTYTVSIANGKNGSPSVGIGNFEVTSNSSGQISTEISDPKYFKYEASWYDTTYVSLQGPGLTSGVGFCVLGSYKVAFMYKCGSIKVYQVDANGDGATCYAGTGGCTVGDKDTIVEATVLKSSGEPAVGLQILIDVTGIVGDNDQQGATDGQGKLTKTFEGVKTGTHDITIELDDFGTNKNLCTGSFTNSAACAADQCETEEATVFDFNDMIEPVGAAPYILCDQINQQQFPDMYTQCVDCAGGSDENAKAGVWTAIGCIRREPAEIAQTLIRVGLMMGGGVALLMMLVAAFILSVSQGEPKRTEDAKDMITAAFMGLLFVVFSVTILQFIGFTILKIPGFGG